MIYIKVGENLYPATIVGKVADKDWDGRESKAITVDGGYAEASSLFSDGISWKIIIERTDEITNEIKQTEFDNSEFSVLGDIIIHNDGTVTIKMGKQTDLENAYEMLYGGVQ